jgi:ribosome assembly protein 4
MSLGGHSDSVESVKWGGEGLLYTASRDKTIQVWAQRGPADPNQQALFKLVRVLNGHAHRINHLSLSTDYLCRTGAFDHTGGFFDAEGKPTSANTSGKSYDREAGHKSAIQRYEAARSQHLGSASSDVPFERLVSCSDDLTIYLWHPTEDKKPIQRMFGHQMPVTHLSFSPDGRYMASASFDKKVKVWCGRTGRFLATLTGHVGHVYQVCWAPDSRLLCSASKDSTLKVWDFIKDPKKPKETLSGHLDEVYALDWAPNGELLASGGKDRLLKIWAE